MSEKLGAYQRVDWKKIQDHSEVTEQSTGIEVQENPESARGVRWWIIPFTVLLCILQAVATSFTANIYTVILTPTLIAVGAFLVAFLLVAMINPVLRGIFRGRWIQPFNRPELVSIFAALMVTSGVSTFGLTSHLLPLIQAPWNPEWNTAQRGWDQHLTKPDAPLLNPKLYLTDPDVIRTFREGVDVVAPPEGAGWGERLAYQGEVFLAIPWGAWVMPVFYWLIFIFACYGLFYSLTYVVLPFWVEREKLIFPLSQLSNDIIVNESAKHWLPPIFRTGAFWVGFAISMMVLSWNGAVAAGWVPSLFRIDLGMGIHDVNDIVRGTFLDPLQSAGGGIRLTFLIIFTAIGIAFLLPTQISFSIWFYFFMAQLMVLGAAWMGYGETARDFPSDFRSTNNFITSQGAGALMVFSAICLFRAVREYFLLARGRSIIEWVKLAFPVVCLGFFMSVIIFWLQWNGISFFWGTVVVLVITLLTTGVMRMVAEAGIYWFQTHVGFFHLYQTFGLGRWISPSMAAPLFPIYTVLFMDTKTFMAPNIMTGAKMQIDARHGRMAYHWTIILSIVITVLAVIAFELYLGHLRGSQQMFHSFYNSTPVASLDMAASYLQDQPQMNVSNAAWYVVGGVWVGLSMFIRQTVFWFPHPIGYVGLFNPLVGFFWFSFFIGWIVKSVTVKYGGKSTFDSIKPLFIGLIIGEILAIVVWIILGFSFEFESGIDLNRTRP